MIKADSQLAYNVANIELTGIRYRELNYFNYFLSTIGIEAAVILIAAINAISQTQAKNIAKFVFFPSASITVVSSFHCIITSIFASYYGNGT